MTSLTSKTAALGAAVLFFVGPTLRAADADPVLAKRGTAEMTRSELDARLAEIPPDKLAGFLSDPERIDQVISQVLLVEQLADEAVDAGLDKDPRVARQLDLARKRILGQLRLEQLRAEAGRNVDAAQIARERYLAEKSRFVIAETRSARHILFDTDKRSEEEALAAAEAARVRLAAGESFEALARELSDDTGSRDAGGLIADIPRGRTDPAFETALFGLAQAGDRTAPVKSRFGYHLIELESVQPERQQTFDEVRATLEAETLAQQVERQLKNHTDQLQGLPIEADLEKLDAIRTRPPGTAAGQ
jgi:parvulin-like peptidyl-prolyl isomerase